MRYTIETTEHFDQWLSGLKDKRAKTKIAARLLRISAGNLGDHKSVGGGLSEIRITEGKGYRLYYTIRGNTVIFMLAGGDKGTQQADITLARKLKEELSHD
ncbi:putative addiction module killer protein [Neisseria sp. oral taxon 020 str. F0370]|uniref:type II toxin-antitoxin system RelE/ParE family toxin n=1 Tax=unclassified Neisseria TaxID=2623750 RepID=UPI0002A22289|nr:MULTISPECIES: type II toxin-antitoxin system RelE/ParE family toxin [unclassified Neisseria]ASP18378.1 addiction module antitoxin RelB [Neisseria sp. KEM232]EKY08825.1 putative addiction module killer protein [Neisseria sp. oral taxon 020 str. F0370]